METQREYDEYEPLVQVKKYVKKMLPEFVLAFVMTFILQVIVGKLSLKEAILLLWNGKWELLLMQWAGFDMSATNINGVTIQLPITMIGVLIITWFMVSHRKFYLNIIAPLAPIIIYAHIINTYGNLSQWLVFENWYCIGALRGVAGMFLGSVSYLLYVKVFRNILKMRFLYFSLGFSILLLIAGRNYITYNDEILWVAVFAFLIPAIYCQPESSSATLKRIVNYLGCLSYPIFLVHYGVAIALASYVKKDRDYRLVIPYFIIVFVLAWCVRLVGKRMKIVRK